MKMPSDIQAAYDRLSDNTPPLAVARALADIEGNLGEAYTVTDGKTLYIFSKRLGEPHKSLSFPLDELDDLEIEQDRPFVFLKIHGDQGVLRLKYGSLDSDDLQTFVNFWNEHRPSQSDQEDDQQDEAEAATPAPPPLPSEVKQQPDPDAEDAADDVPPLTAFVGFAAALQSMIEVDGSVDGEETHLLNRMIDRPDVVTSAIKYLRAHGPERLRMALSLILDHKQKLCLMANLLELSMVDGYLKSSEQELLRAYVDQLGIDEEEYQKLYEVLGVKNNLSIFAL